MNNPTKAKVNGTIYDINTDFRVAIKCNNVANDKSICDTERALAIIYLLYGDKGLEIPENYAKLLEIGQKFLLCGNEYEEPTDEADFDFEQDMNYIETSFMSDYGINIDKDTKIHWWKFNDLLNGLSNSELGNCCVLNRIRNLRNFDTNKIDDVKERTKIEEAQKRVALKKKTIEFTKEQQESADLFDRLINGKEE